MTDCEQCQHDFDDHLVVASGDDAKFAMLNGGVILCIEDDCRCSSTWALGDLPAPEMPDDETLDQLRSDMRAVMEIE